MPDSAPLDVVALAIDLMRIDSTSGREGEVIELVHRLLAGRGWRVRRIPVSEGRDDLLATAADAPAVVLSTHLDTVPPYLPPRLEETRLWGRGACDAKGIAASMMVAAERLRARDVPVALLFVVGEETVHDGAHAANESPLRPASVRALVNGEPTESTLGVGTKGGLRVTVRTAGEAAHSAYPHLGHSAIDDMVALLHELRGMRWPSDEVLGDTTVNVGTIAGGVADNVVAAAAEARIMVRLVTPADDIRRRLEDWARGRATLTEAAMVPVVRLKTVAGFPTSVVAYATDIPALDRWGQPYLFGPGSIHVAHTADEYIELDELRGAVGAYERIVREVLGLRD